MTKTTFTTTIFQAEGKNATGIKVPAEAVEALGKGKRPPVKVSVGDYTYRSTVAGYGDVFLLPFSAEHRDASGLGAGDEVEVTLELDTEPRTVELPDDLAQALEEAGVTEAFDKSAPSARKEFVRQVESAKAQDTRERRIAKIVEKLRES
ncbi:MAG: YdeI/OmpD-associated family protein [Aggregatilineales bacterium]